MHWVAYCADRRMMFRQIRILPEHENLQSIIWSPSADEPERYYVLLTVTYKETCAPYLTLRTLRQLFHDEGLSLHEAVESIEKDLYVNEFLGDATDVESARRRINQLNSLFRVGGFELKKWVSNDPELLSDLPLEDQLHPSSIHLSAEGPDTGLLTKRRLLSEIPRLTPVTVVAKKILQDLWKKKLDWDQELSTELACHWRQFRNDLHDVSTLALPRWLGHSRAHKPQFHVFSEASSRALAAAVYARVSADSNSEEFHFVIARGKLASFMDLSRSKNTCMPIWRLQLRAALLAAQLFQTTEEQVNVALKDCNAWTDSQVVLHWLRSDEPLSNELVNNYVSQVQE
ncbi:uncharacterized protein LOC117176360 [Belonocnema kinseyi]|uniref:uncharacterized protein LOC117176360 n=1 Tax=Belonocnema kinseyi TaxID=2817044 RepID=UPI00143DC6C9|nr:uncharacterized protein LOC117176360 [Belonocnema kinseyi]